MSGGGADSLSLQSIWGMLAKTEAEEDHSFFGLGVGIHSPCEYAFLIAAL